MLFHCAAHLHVSLPFPISILGAFPGVPIFFVTSGFLIASSYDRSSALIDFARKRILRLFPALWVCIGLTVAVLLFLGYPLATRVGLTWTVAQLFALIYTPGMLRNFGFGSYNGSLWTLPIECQFYVTIPILTELVAHRRHATNILLGLLTFFLGVALWGRWSFPSLLSLPGEEFAAVKLFRYSFAPHYFLFLTGFIAYHLRFWAHPIIQCKALYWVGAVLAFNLVADGSALSSMLQAVLVAGCTLACAYSPVRIRHALAGNDISYGIYIYHGLLINLALTAGLDGHWAAMSLVILLAYVLGFVSWRVVEQPSLRLKRATATTSRTPEAA